MAKKEREPFKWDTEEHIGTVEESEKVKHEIKRTTLNGKEFISTEKVVMTKNGWEGKGFKNFESGVFAAIAKTVLEGS